MADQIAADGISSALRKRRWLALITATLALTACLPELAVTYDSTSTSKVKSVILTSDGSDRYSFVSTPGSMEAAALPGNIGSNLRTVFWPDTAPAVAASQGCARWTSQTGDLVQQGAAIRIRNETGRIRAITVTKNIWYYASWIFNFHTWDSAGSPKNVQFGSTAIPALFGTDGKLAPLPWTFCVRAVDSAIEFKVWPSSATEPAWGDPTWGGQARIPDGWSTAGKTGWYIAHLARGQQARFDDLRTWKYNGTPAPIPTTTTSTSTTSTSTTSTTTGPTTSTTEPTSTSTSTSTTTTTTTTTADAGV